PDCLFMFSSHLIELSEQLEAARQVDCRHFEAKEDADRLRFDYVLRSGVSRQRLGMRVLREEGIFDLLDNPPGLWGSALPAIEPGVGSERQPLTCRSRPCRRLNLARARNGNP